MRNASRPSTPAVRVMQSFGPPRPTTNPYIHMLDAALAETAGVDHLRFDRRRALLGRYDALHLHWPELLLRGSSPSRTLARRAFAMALRLRLSVTEVALIHTVHNVRPHSDSTRWERRYLAWLDRRVDHRIVLNEQTELAPGAASTLIPHGHYRDWFASVPSVPPTPGLLSFVGLVRPYKGVEELLDAFASTAATAPALRLRIAGSPSSAQLERDVRERAGGDARVELDFRYLTEPEFANVVMESAGVVLPYRFMHNSGSALAALSLRRPVLVPRTDVNEALAREVGPGWVTMFDGALTGADLERFAEGIHPLPTAAPDLSAREWASAGDAHRSAYVAAVARRRGGARS
ncbi:glycosyltransferase [Agrococcus jenensis]|uniref:Glycosyltransferase involved in cell wall biosynthesis n=1 Tax=Agrococcus jenensis TaxID=46353 RepID=A0A3N2AWH9_9MICO|nr:glycosyltransferase [Agrococcus jenensis]ROR67381.1 glycosyltransferase involved in cell wall biosynthesis [Agrococcus jenensis]